jgi:hypothetical protein
MHTRAIVLPMLAAAALLFGAAGAASRPQSDSAALRRALATQPDHSATVTTVMYASDHAFGGKSKVARLGKRRFEDNGSAVFISEAGKPTIKVYHDRKQYAEVAPDEGPASEFEPEALAAREDVTFKLLGKEKVGEYETLEIEATVPLGKQKELRAVFYAAPGLKNLVVKEEYFAGAQPLVMSFLEGVTLEVSEKLFVVPRGYAKVVEKTSPADPATELLEELRKPAGGKSRPPKPRR